VLCNISPRSLLVIKNALKFVESSFSSDCCCNSDAASSDADDEEDPTTDLTISSTLMGSTYTATTTIGGGRTASIATDGDYGDYSLASTIGAGYEMIALQQLGEKLFLEFLVPTSVLLGHAIRLFSGKELSGSREKEK
jgi:hypothetical protein